MDEGSSKFLLVLTERVRGAVGRTFASLDDHNFRYLSVSTIAIGFGQWGQQIALGWLVFVLTGSAVQLGGVAFTGGIVSLAVTPLAGVAADRYPRRTIILLATVASAAEAILLALLVVTDLVEMWHVYAMAAAGAAIAAVNLPARQAYVFDISTKEKLANAIALDALAQNSARVIGPSLAGLLAAVGLAAPFIFVAAANLAGAFATMRMDRGPCSVKVGTSRLALSPLPELVAGVHYLLGDTRLAGLLALTALPALLVYSYVALLPIFAEEVLGGGATTYGLLAAAGGVGSVIGLLILAFVGDFPHQGRLMLIGLLIYLASIIGFTQSVALWLSLVLLVIGGFFNGSQLALNTTLFQRLVRVDMRGRGMAAWQFGRNVGPFGALPMALAVSEFGVQRGSVIFVIACLGIVTLFAVFWRSGREL